MAAIQEVRTSIKESLPRRDEEAFPRLFQQGMQEAIDAYNGLSPQDPVLVLMPSTSMFRKNYPTVVLPEFTASETLAPDSYFEEINTYFQQLDLPPKLSKQLWSSLKENAFRLAFLRTINAIKREDMQVPIFADPTFQQNYPNMFQGTSFSHRSRYQDFYIGYPISREAELLDEEVLKILIQQQRIPNFLKGTTYDQAAIRPRAIHYKEYPRRNVDLDTYIDIAPGVSLGNKMVAINKDTVPLVQNHIRRIMGLPEIPAKVTSGTQQRALHLHEVKRLPVEELIDSLLERQEAEKEKTQGRQRRGILKIFDKLLNW